MARSDLLVDLVRAGSQSDHRLFRRTVEELVAEERAKNHHVLADRLLAQLNSNGSAASIHRSKISDRDSGFLVEVTPRRTIDDLILPESVSDVVGELVEEQFRADLLRTYNLEPRHRVLLVGPPGNGKTSLAEALASALMLPLIIVRYDAVIGSYLGETAKRLKGLFEQVRSQRCVLFFDEFDALGKERGDVHETGEIKRVVSSLLLQIDDLPSYTVVVTATNHPELLDRAVWRRFQIRLELPQPGRHQVLEWIERFEKRLGQPLGVSHRTLSAELNGLSFSELDDFGADVYRRYVLNLPTSNVKSLIQSRLRQLHGRYESPAGGEQESRGD